MSWVRSFGSLFLKRVIRNKEKEGPLAFMLNTWHRIVCVCVSVSKKLWCCFTDTKYYWRLWSKIEWGSGQGIITLSSTNRKKLPQILNANFSYSILLFYFLTSPFPSYSFNRNLLNLLTFGTHRVHSPNKNIIHELCICRPNKSLAASAS